MQNRNSNKTLTIILTKPLVVLNQFEEFLKADWGFPKVHRNKLRQVWRMFDAHARTRMAERMKFKYTASELFGLYMLLRFFMLSVVVSNAERKEADIDAEPCTEIL